MQAFFLLVVLAFIVACWTLVIGSQVGWSAFDIERYAVWRMTWPIAYMVAGLSFCAAFMMIVVAFIRR